MATKLSVEITKGNETELSVAKLVLNGRIIHKTYGVKVSEAIKKMRDYAISNCFVDSADDFYFLLD